MGTLRMDTGSASQRPIAWARPPAVGRGWGTRAAERLRARLARPRTTWEIAGLVLITLLPTVWSGLAFDDLLHRLVVEGKMGPSLSRLDLFAFISPDPAQRAHFEELGIYPWWIGPHMQVSYWRPVAALTHFVDYSLWPRAAWLMHLENLAWYGALVVTVGAFYRRFVSVAWVAGFAAACYAFDQAHAYPVAWVANRNAIMAAFFGVVAVLAHDRWRTSGRTWFGAAAGGAFTLGILSAESGVAMGGYLLAYALVFEADRIAARGATRARAALAALPSVAPYAGVVVVWRVAYRAMGYGVLASGANLDPLVDRGAFLVHAAQTLPILVASEITNAPPDVLLQHQAWMAAATVAGLAVLAVFAKAIGPLVRRDRTSVFFAAGALLSAVPLGGLFPSDRYLFWVGLGVFGLVAQLAGLVFGTPGRIHPARYAVCCALILLRGVLSPALFPCRAAGPGLLEDDYEQMVDSMPRGPDFAEQTVVLVNAPLDLFASVVPIVAMGRGKTLPAHMYTLYAGTDDVTLARAGDDAIAVHSERGWLEHVSDRIFRGEPLPAGSQVELAAMSARVEGETKDGRPTDVVFRFPTRLEDPALVFLAWGERGFERVAPPLAGAKVSVPAAPFYTKDILRPHLRQRAVEDDAIAGR
ncbi:MAG TPA: hypothetical protein VHV30_11355 [Polyangiaceae bacterium]|nr:hypothetical protein [Polyangiaceae bacterium]